MKKLSISEMLRHYFNNTNIEEIVSVWESTSIYDDVNSPTVEVFIENVDCFEIENDPPEFDSQNFDNTIESPNFTSDFLFI